MVVTSSVLVVDDEPMARMLVRLTLARAGFDVQEAEDGYDAIEKLGASLPDLMILDVMMPGMDGFAVCKWVRANEGTVDVPIIMLSAKTDIASIERGLELGANKYLTKPISPDDLTRQVQDVLAAC